MGIGKITFGNFGSNIFKTNNGQNIQSENVQETGKVTTNPFGVSFKGNVIHADVFESSKINETKDAAQNNITTRGKLFISAVVGNINNFNDAIKSRMNSIVSFGKRITEKTVNTIQKIANTEVNFKTMGEGIKNTIINPYSVRNLTKRPVIELEAMLKEEIA